MNEKLKVFFVFYSTSGYNDTDGQSVVIAEDFQSAIDKWERAQWGGQKVRMTKVELYWEFPII